MPRTVDNFLAAPKPNWVKPVNDAHNALANGLAVGQREPEMKDFQKRSKKAASLITKMIDCSIVMSLDMHGKNYVAMWNMLAANFNIGTLASVHLQDKNLSFSQCQRIRVIWTLNNNITSYSVSCHPKICHTHTCHAFVLTNIIAKCTAHVRHYLVQIRAILMRY